MHILMNVVNTDTPKSVDILLQLFVNFLFSVGGAVALISFAALVALTIWFDSPKWIWLTLAIYMCTLGYSNDPYADNHLATPLQELRPLNRTVSTGMLVLLLIPTMKASRGWRSRLLLGSTLSFFVFELVFSARFVAGTGMSRGIVGFAMYPLAFTALAVGLSSWLQTPDDVYRLLRCFLTASGLTMLGTLYQLMIRSSAVIANGRLLGTTNNPQHLGTSMAFTLPVACLIMLRRKEPMFWRVAGALFGGVAVIFILWTQSRASLIVVATGLLIFFRARLGKAVASAAALGLIVLFIVGVLGVSLPGTERLFSTFDTRSGVWSRLWGKFLANPILGSGSEADAAESSYLSALSQFGLMGSIPLAVALFCMVRESLRLLRRRNSLGELAEVADLVMACVGSMLLLGCFESYLLGTATDYLYCFYALLAIGAFLLDPANPWDQSAIEHAGTLADPDAAYDWEAAMADYAAEPEQDLTHSEYQL